MNVIFTHLGDTFPVRKSEWYLGVCLFLWGTVLIRPEVTFNLSPSYAGLLNLASEEMWGWGCLLVGGLRLTALFINGTWVPATYRLRTVTSALSFLFWFSISYGMLVSDVATTGLAMYPATAILELLCLLQTGRDYKLHELVKQSGVLNGDRV